MSRYTCAHIFFKEEMRPSSRHLPSLRCSCWSIILALISGRKAEAADGQHTDDVEHKAWVMCCIVRLLCSCNQTQLKAGSIYFVSWFQRFQPVGPVSPQAWKNLIEAEVSSRENSSLSIKQGLGDVRAGQALVSRPFKGMLLVISFLQSGPPPTTSTTYPRTTY